MSSTATARNRLEKQGTGDNNNSWGSKLNTTMIDLIDAALDGMASYTLSGAKTLTSVNYAADEARMTFQNITGGTGGTVTIPAVEKWYLVRNGTSGDVVFTTGGSTNATIKSGDTAIVGCDATNVYLAQILDFGSSLPSSSGTPSSGSHLTNKAYVDAAIAAAVLGGVTTTGVQLGSTLTPSGSATASFTGISQSYGSLKVEVLGVSHNSGSNQQLQIELSPDGSTWATAAAISGTTAGSGTLYGDITLPGYTKAAGSCIAALSNLTANNTSGTTGISNSLAWRISAGVQAMRLSWTGAANFDAGSIKLWGFL